MKINIKFIYSVILAGCHIGVVDDDPHIVRTLEIMLRDDGHEGQTTTEKSKKLIGFIKSYIKNTRKIPIMYEMYKCLVDDEDPY
jgi:hypothetical protein